MINIQEEAARCLLCRLVCPVGAISPAKRVPKQS
jgi:NAD-dependent dihydropyrimidine dehydrogenase PreA subunit